MGSLLACTRRRRRVPRSQHAPYLPPGMRHPGHPRHQLPLVAVESNRYISPYRSQEAPEEVRVRTTRTVPARPVLITASPSPRRAHSCSPRTPRRGPEPPSPVRAPPSTTAPPVPRESAAERALTADDPTASTDRRDPRLSPRAGPHPRPGEPRRQVHQAGPHPVPRDRPEAERPPAARRPGERRGRGPLGGRAPALPRHGDRPGDRRGRPAPRSGCAS